MTNVYDLKEKEPIKKTNTLYDMCKNDLDAIGFLAKACSYPDNAFKRMEENDITGSDLYTLYHDCCDDNVIKALYVMTEDAIEDIKTHIKDKKKFT